MRRGEALALRWRDVDLDAGRLAVRRSAGVVKAKGAGERLVEGPTETGRSRVVDLDAGTVAALRAYRAARGGPALDLVRDSALVLSNLDGTHRHPERFSRRFAGQVARAHGAGGGPAAGEPAARPVQHQANLAAGRGRAVGGRLGGLGRIVKENS